MTKAPTRCLGFILLLLYSITLPATPSWANELELPAELLARLPDGMEIVRREQVDFRNCGDSGESMTAVAADFDGNGLVDYVTLADNGPRTVTVQDTTYPVREIRILAFLQKDDQDFELHTLDVVPVRYPTIMVIERQLPLEIVEWGTRNRVKLDWPGILRVFCQKSASVFYWDGEGFGEVWISD
jgi:hypothetical protein